MDVIKKKVTTDETMSTLPQTIKSGFPTNKADLDASLPGIIATAFELTIIRVGTTL